MKIGIISKPEHAKVHAQRLRDEGHEVDILGNVGEFPSSYDVFVCRVASTSHQSFWDSISEAKKTGRPVLIENSVTKILEKIRNIQEGNEMNNWTIDKKVSYAIEGMGLYCPNVVYSDTELTSMADMGISDRSKARLARDVIKDVKYGSIIGYFSAQKKREDRQVYHFSKYVKAGRSHTRSVMHFLAPERIATSKLRAFARMMELDLVPRWDQEQEEQEVQTPVQPEEQAMETQTVEVIPEEHPVVEVTPVAQPVEPPVEPPPVAPVLVQTPRTRSKADVKDLISLLNEALLALNVAEIKMIPSATGPQVEIKQVVVRQVATVDELE